MVVGRMGLAVAAVSTSVGGWLQPLRAPQRPLSERAPRHYNLMLSVTTHESLATQCDYQCDSIESCQRERLAVLHFPRAAGLEGQMTPVRTKGANASTPLRYILRLGPTVRTLTTIAEREAVDFACEKVSGVFLCSRCHCAPFLERQGVCAFEQSVEAECPVS